MHKDRWTFFENVLGYRGILKILFDTRRVSVNGKPQVSKTWTVGSIPITRATQTNGSLPKREAGIPITRATQTNGSLPKREAGIPITRAIFR